MVFKRKIIKNYIKRFALSSFGFSILALGLAIINQLNVGKSIFSNVSLGLRDVLRIFGISLSIGNSFIIVDVLVSLVAWSLFLIIGIRKNLLGALFVAFFLGSFIDFWIWILNIPDFTNMLPFWQRALFIIPIVVFTSFGVALSIASHLIVGALDLATLYVSKVMKKSFTMSRSIIMVLFFTIGIIFMTISGDFSHLTFVTFVFSFTNGKLIQMWLGTATKIYNFVMKL